MAYVYNNETKKMENVATPWWHDGVWSTAKKAADEEEKRRAAEPLFGKWEELA